MPWILVCVVLALFLLGPVCQAESSSNEAWQAWLEAHEVATFGELDDVNARKFFSPAFLTEIGWPGQNLDGWLKFPLLSISDVHGHDEKRLDNKICLLLHGYSSGGSPRLVSLEYREESARNGQVKIRAYYLVEADRIETIPDQPLCPEELEAWRAAQKGQGSLME